MTHERDRFSLIGHSAMPFMSPLAEDELFGLVSPHVAAGDHVLDAGGGRGDLAAMVARRLACRATSVDRSPAACDVARERTQGLDVVVRYEDAVSFVRACEDEAFALACAVGAVHAFGNGREGWIVASRALGRVGRRVLVADLVALGPRAADAFEIATLDELDVAASASARVVLSPSRVEAYEKEWAAGLARHLEAHPNDPRADWARQRIAWTTEPSLREAREQLAFAAFVI